MDTDLTQRLIASRANGDFAPAWLVGAIDLHQALDLQLAVLDDLLERGATIGGWKVGLTSESSRQKLGADERPFGFVLADKVLASGESVAAAAIRDLSIEAEMCFTMGADIADPDIGPDRILDFVAEVSAGLELNEARPGSARPDFPVLVTDCLTNWGIVHGTGIAPGPDHARTAATLSATTVREPMCRPSLRLAAASSGMTTIEATARAIPTVDSEGSVREVRSHRARPPT